MPRSNAYLYQMVTRTRARASELHLVNCHFPPTVVPDLIRFFEEVSLFSSPIDSEDATQ
jgi:hypothetical protein